MNKSPETVVIRRITPSLDNARFAVKRAVGEEITVEADVFKDGHDEISVLLKWRQTGQNSWRETAMRPLINDRWTGTLSVTSPGAWEYTIEAWGDVFFSWQHELEKNSGPAFAIFKARSSKGLPSSNPPQNAPETRKTANP